MMPAATAHTAIELTSSVVPIPLRSAIRPHSQTAAITPSAMSRP